MILYHGTNVEFEKIHERCYHSIFLWNGTCNKYVETSMNEVMEMKAYMVNKLAMMLMEHDREMSMEQALGIVFNSDTYQKIMNDKTRLYYQSPLYVFSFLDQELKLGKMN